MDKSLQYAKALRGWQEENPKTDLALGFVPGVGQVLGAAEAAAAMRDPDASKLEKGMGAASMLPIGKVVDKLRKIVISSTLARNIPELKKVAEEAEQMGAAGLSNEWISKNTDGQFFKDPLSGEVMHELDDSAAKIDWQMMDIADQAGDATDLGSVYNHQRLFQADPSLSAVPVHFDDAYLKSQNANGMYDLAELGSDFGKVTLKSVPEATAPAMRKYAKTLNHETQHAIDDRVGLLSGNPPDRRGYWSSADEIRARLSAERMRLTAEGRKKVPFREHMIREHDRLTSLDDDMLGNAPDDFLKGLFEEKGLDLSDYIK